MTEHLPSLDTSVDVPASAIESIATKGHAVLRGLCTREEAAAYRPIIERAALDTAYDKRPLEERETYGKAFLQSFNLWRVDPDIARFVLAPRFARAAATLLGVERVRLYHDQALCKEPGGGHTPWHQDQLYWPMDTDRTITMWMPLVDVPAEIGSMTFANGTHLLGDLRGAPISDESEREFAAFVADKCIPTETHGAMTAGDATFHLGWTLHSAGNNPTDLLRTVMTVIYVADGARVLPELTKAQEFDRGVWLGGRMPGELIDSDRNPLLG